MTGKDWYFIISILTAGFALAIATIMVALSQGRAIEKALESIARPA